jgi:hypothetical protein
MNTSVEQALFPDAGPRLSEHDLAERSGLSVTEVHVLVECGALTMRGGSYSIECLTVARRAQRLRDELALDDVHALAVVLRLRQRIADLEAELEGMRARLW